jgi:hypothetical protein
MWNDDFDRERYRAECVLEILEHAARRLDERAYVPLTVVRDAVAFIAAAEDAAYDAAQAAEDSSALSARLRPHWAMPRALTGMQDALNALDSGDASAAARFARYARQYLELRQTQLRSDPSPQSERLFDRLAKAAAILDIGAPAW